MKRKRSIIPRIFSLIYIIILIFIIYKLYGIYKIYSFNDFEKAEHNLGVSKFTRDLSVIYSEMKSYKIESPEFNDALFYKTIEVKKNTPYKVSCMVKTENVEAEIPNSDAGATICILDTTEISENITGTNDWQKLEFIFNSKNRETIQIGFRLGGNICSASGTAWFSDFKLEEGSLEENTSWKVGCFIFKSIDVSLEGENIALNMTREDIDLINTNMKRFKNSCKELSNNQMKVNYEIHEIKEPLTTISYSEEYGYYIDPYDVKDIIGETVLENEYDYIFVAIRMGSTAKDIEIPVNDWIGLRRNGLIWSRFFKYKNAK